MIYHVSNPVQVLVVILKNVKFKHIKPFRVHSLLALTAFFDLDAREAEEAREQRVGLFVSSVSKSLIVICVHGYEAFLLALRLGPYQLRCQVPSQCIVFIL